MNYKKWAGIGAGIAGLTLSIHAQTENAPVETQTPPGTAYTVTQETPPAPAQPTPGTQYNTPEEATTQPGSQDSEHYKDLYHACEISVDLFGVGSLHESQRTHGVITRHPAVHGGGGVGVNVFLSKYLGIGGDFYSITFKRSFVDTTTGNLIFRLPLGHSGLAPYIFAGAGYQFQGIDQIVGGGGGGIEWRLVEHFSIFSDVRYLAAVKTRGYGLWRGGIRLSF